MNPSTRNYAFPLFKISAIVSGQLGMDPKTMELVGPDVEKQANQALANMGEILKCEWLHCVYDMEIQRYLLLYIYNQTKLSPN